MTVTVLLQDDSCAGLGTATQAPLFSASVSRMAAALSARGSDLAAAGPRLLCPYLADIPEQRPHAGRGPGHPEGSPLMLGLWAVLAPAQCSRIILMALHLHGGGDSQEGAAPRQGRPGAGLALLQPALRGQRHVIHMRSQEALLARTPDGDSG